MTWLVSRWRALAALCRVFPVAGLFAVFLAGVVFWGGFNWSLELTNTESFCISCHVMKEHVYGDYKVSSHHDNRTGVRAACPDCHVPREWVHKVVRKVRASNELYYWLVGSIDTADKFKAKQLELAQRVWASMAKTDSRECRNCHEIGFMKARAQDTKAAKMHELAQAWGTTCIDCHQGIVHSLPQGFDKGRMMDELHERMETEKVNCRLCHEGIAQPPAGDGWD